MAIFVVLEGIDGSGKTTQAKLLYEALRRDGYDAVLLSEPTNGKYGRLIRDKLVSGEYTAEELYNLFVLDRKENAKKIRFYLEKGDVVIMDRYYISTIAYQGSQGIPIKKIIEDHRGLPQPNLVVILDIEPKKALKRITSGDTFENVSFLEKVRSIYLEIPRILDIPCCEIRIVDGDRNINVIHEEIYSLVRDKMANKNGCKKI